MKIFPMQIKEIKGPINIINEFTTRVRLMITSENKTLRFVSDLLMLGNVPFFSFYLVKIAKYMIASTTYFKSIVLLSL